MEQPHSPIPKKIEVKDADVLMDFPTAIKAVIEGKKIQREEWDQKEVYGFLNGDLLSLHKPEGNFQWIVNDGDLKSDDWKIIN